MHWVFGSFKELELDESAALRLVDQARSRKPALCATPIEHIIDVIDAAGRLWRRGGPFFDEAARALENELSFSRPMIERSLELVPAICDGDALRRRLDAELGDRRALDAFVARPGCETRVRAVPLGVLLHVSAGNVFLGCIDSLVSAFLSKNISIMKTSSRNQVFPGLFARALSQADPERVLADKFALVHWAGGRANVEDAFKRSVDAIIAWGGAEMARAYRRGLDPGTRLIEHGPKISFQVVYNDALQQAGLEAASQRLARDIVLWDQAACASPQNLFYESGIDPEALMRAIGRALDAEGALPRGRLSDDEKVEWLKERSRAKLTSLVEGGHLLEGGDWLLHHDPTPGLRPSALNRCLILKSFASEKDLASQLVPYAPELQSCSYLANEPRKTALLDALSAAGVQRFAPAGRIMVGAVGAPHDGRFALAELTRLVGDEEVPEEPAGMAIGQSDAVAAARGRAGYLFSSGGTTGSPKRAFFTSEEFTRVGEMLAKGFRAQGLARGDLCANLFVAGNLWSSFLAVEKALAAAGAVQLPIGGTAEPDLALGYLEEFKPRFAFGLPSLLAALGSRALEKGARVEVPFVCYAGEHMNRQTRELLARAWGTRRCFSAGYASVDAGPIGYQCLHCGDREHHLFAGDVRLEIVDGEAVVTSLVRRAMPVVRLRTGDHVEWSTPAWGGPGKPGGASHGAGPRCACGSADPKFILHGRCDGRINLWSSRIQLPEIEQGLYSAGIRQPVFQVSVEDDRLTVSIEGASLESPEAAARAQAAIYESCKDLRITRPLDFVRPRLLVQGVAPGSLARLPRTGKVKSVVDLRRL